MQLAIANLDSEYDSIARAACTEKQLAMLEAIPLRLPHLSSADLLAEGLRIRRSYDEVARIIRAGIEKREGAVPAIMQRAMVVEHLLRHTCLIFVDEVQRRRGVTPRAANSAEAAAAD